MEKSKLSEPQLRRLAAQYNDREIGDMFGVSPKTIQKKRSKLGVPAFQKVGGRRRFKPDPKELEALYQVHSMREIADHFGVGETVVWTRIKEMGIVNKEDPQRGHRRRPGWRPNSEQLAAIRGAARKRRGKFVGENSPHWKGGVSGKARQGRSVAAHRDWKAEVLNRAAHMCERCGIQHMHKCSCCKQEVRLHVHHIKPYKEHPDLRYEPSNGMALCPSCHYKEHFD